MTSSVLLLAWRNVSLHRRRYMLMGGAIAIGFMLMSVVAGVAFGAMETLKFKAARYFSGHVSVTGYSNGRPYLANPAGAMDAITRAGLPIRLAASRTIYYNSDARLLFGGETVKQRRLIGIDFRQEQSVLAGLSFKQGGIEGMLSEQGRNGILISEQAAKILGARIGDDVNIALSTDYGAFSTAAMVVRGVFVEAGLFGFVAYLRSEDLNRLLGRPKDSATDIAIFAARGANIVSLGDKVGSALSEGFDVYPRISDKAVLQELLSKDPDGLAVLTMDAHLAQIIDLLGAFFFVVYFVMGIFTIILMVGVVNTYRAIVHERTMEIGTMRALGMSRGRVASLFLLEATLLSGMAAFVGLVAAFAAMLAISFWDGSGLQAIGMFLDGSSLRSYLPIWACALNFAILSTGVIFAALGPAVKAARIEPIEALRRGA